MTTLSDEECDAIAVKAMPMLKALAEFLAFLRGNDAAPQERQDAEGSDDDCPKPAKGFHWEKCANGLGLHLVADGVHPHERQAQPVAWEVGGRYNWKNQPERLIYMGMCEPRNGRWHQFSLADKPGVVWCEVKDADLHMIERTREPGTRQAQPVCDELLRRFLKLSSYKSEGADKLRTDVRAYLYTREPGTGHE